MEPCSSSSSGGYSCFCTPSIRCNEGVQGQSWPMHTVISNNLCVVCLLSGFGFGYFMSCSVARSTFVAFGCDATTCCWLLIDRFANSDTRPSPRKSFRIFQRGLHGKRMGVLVQSTSERGSGDSLRTFDFLLAPAAIVCEEHKQQEAVRVTLQRLATKFLIKKIKTHY